MAMRKPSDDGQLPLIDEPITYSELAVLFGEHDQTFHELQEAKNRVKELKAEYEESQNKLVHAGRRVRRTAQREQMQSMSKALRNREIVPDNVDFETGEITD